MILFNGICTALVTPFCGGKVDYDALEKLINIQIENKTDAVLILGTTGEASTLSFSEKQEIIKFTFETVANRIPVIVGIGGNNPASIIELGQFVRSQVKLSKVKSRVGVLVTAPYYNKATQAGLVKYFNAIANEVRLPMIVYNVPGRTGMNIEPDTYLALDKNKYFCGIKECNFDQLGFVRAALPEKIAVYSGDDVSALPAFTLGACGVISVASNIRPSEMREIYLAHKARRISHARKLFQQQLPFFKSLFVQVNPIPVKYYLSKKGLCANELRLPLTPIERL